MSTDALDGSSVAVVGVPSPTTSVSDTEANYCVPCEPGFDDGGGVIDARIIDQDNMPLKPAGLPNSLTEFILSKNLNIPKKDKASETHLRLDGGRLLVSPEIALEFNRHVAQALFYNEPIYIIERRTNIFKMFAELDYISKKPLPFANVIYLASHFQQKVFRPAFESITPATSDVLKDPLTVVVSMTKPGYMVTDFENKKCTKSGIHLNWLLPVSQDTAIDLRHFMMQEFTRILAHSEHRLASSNSPPSNEGDSKAFASFIKKVDNAEATQSSKKEKKKSKHVIFDDNTKPVNPLDELFDDCVYLRNGLRMIGCHKAVRCPICKGVPCRNSKKSSADNVDPTMLKFVQTREPKTSVDLCDTCCGTSKVDMGRPYMPIAVLDRNGKMQPEALKKLYEDHIALVNTTSIRLLDTNIIEKKITNSAMMDELCDIRKSFKVHKKLTKNAKAKTVDVDGVSRTVVKQMDGNALESVPITDQRYGVISNLVHEFYNLAKADITDLKKDKAGTLYVLTTKSKFCLNKNDNHSHARVYYVIRPNGMSQKCFSRKDMKYFPSNQTCKEYASPIREINEAARRSLFSSAVCQTFYKLESAMADTNVYIGYRKRFSGTKRDLNDEFFFDSISNQNSQSTCPSPIPVPIPPRRTKSSCDLSGEKSRDAPVDMPMSPSAQNMYWDQATAYAMCVDDTIQQDIQKMDTKHQNLLSTADENDLFCDDATLSQDCQISPSKPPRKKLKKTESQDAQEHISKEVYSSSPMKRTDPDEKKRQARRKEQGWIDFNEPTPQDIERKMQVIQSIRKFEATKNASARPSTPQQTLGMLSMIGCPIKW